MPTDQDIQKISTLLNHNSQAITQLEDKVVTESVKTILGNKFPSTDLTHLDIAAKKEFLSNIAYIKEKMGIEMVQNIFLHQRITLQETTYQINSKINIIQFIAQIRQKYESHILTNNSLQLFEKHLTNTSLQQALINLQTDIEQVQEHTTYNIIKDTTLIKAIKTHTNDAETFCTNMDTVRKNYIQNSNHNKDVLDPIVIGNMATGVSFYMMQWIGQQDPTQQNNFWSSIDKRDISEENKSLLQSAQNWFSNASGMLTTMGTSIDIFYKLSNIQKVITKANLNPQSSKKSPILNNPEQFMKMIQDMPLELDENALAQRVQTITPTQPQDIHIDDGQGIQNLKQIANNTTFNKQTYEGLIKFQGIATDFLSKQATYKANAHVLTETILGEQGLIGQITSSLKTVGFLDSKTEAIDLLSSADMRESAIGKVMHVIFLLLGYSDGLDGFLSEYYIEKMNLTSDQKNCISNIYQHYQQKQIDQTHDDNRQQAREKALQGGSQKSSTTGESVMAWFGMERGSSPTRSADTSTNTIYQTQLKTFNFAHFADGFHKTMQARTGNIENCPLHIPQLYQILSRCSNNSSLKKQITVGESKDKKEQIHVHYTLQNGAAEVIKKLFQDSPGNQDQQEFMNLYLQELIGQLQYYENNSLPSNKLLQTTKDPQGNDVAKLDMDRISFLASTYVAAGPLGVKASQQGVWTVSDISTHNTDEQTENGNSQTENASTNTANTNANTANASTNTANASTNTANTNGVDKNPLDEKNFISFGNLLNKASAQPYRKYQTMIEAVSSETGVSSNILLQLLIKEGSKGDPYIVAGGSKGKDFNTTKCVGLGQMGKAAWIDMMNKYGGKPELSDRFDPKSQISQAARYLKHMKETTKSNNRFHAMAYYNSGASVAEENIPSWKKSNPAIAQYMQAGDNTVAGYLAAAEKYYSSIS